MEQNIKGELNMTDKIECMKCGRKLKMITVQHLRSCSKITLDEYKKEFPDAPIISNELKKYRVDNCKKLVNQTKIIKCSKCGINEIEVIANNAWVEKAICDDCRKPETYEGMIYLEEIDKVVCQICWQAFDYLTYTHLKLHNITPIEYRRKFPNSIITNKKIIRQRKERGIGIKNPAKRKEVRERMKELIHFFHLLKK
jgi:predicted transcriptional regulator